MPSISDYWPDAPHRIGPPADHYTDEPTAASVDALRRSGRRDRGTHDTVAEPSARSRSRRPAMALAALAAVLVATAALVGITLTRQGGRDPVTGAAEPWARPTDASQPDATTPDLSPAAPQPIALQTTASADAPARPAFLSAPVRDRDQASFELVSDAAR